MHFLISGIRGKLFDAILNYHEFIKYDDFSSISLWISIIKAIIYIRIKKINEQFNSPEKYEINIV